MLNAFIEFHSVFLVIDKEINLTFLVKELLFKVFLEDYVFEVGKNGHVSRLS